MRSVKVLIARVCNVCSGLADCPPDYADVADKG